MPFCGMLHHVALEGTDVSEERSASIIRMTRIGELGVKLVIISNQHKLRKYILVMEMMRSSETSFPTRTTQLNILEDGILHSHRRENFKSYIVLTGWALRRRSNIFLHSHCRQEPQISHRINRLGSVAEN
jgi:hypothetical protein